MYYTDLNFLVFSVSILLAPTHAAANAVDSSPPAYPSELPPPYIQQPGYQAPPSYEVPPGYQGPPAYQTLPGYPSGQVYQGVPVGYVVATVSFEFVDLQIPVVDLE